MNIKKSFLAALAGATAIATLSAVSVSAASTLGFTDPVEVEGNLQFNIVEGGSAGGTMYLEQGNRESLGISVDIPADAGLQGIINFNAAVVTDLNAIEAAAGIDGIGVLEVLDLFFTDENGEIIDMTGKDVVISIKTDDYNTVYYYNNETLENMNATYENSTLTFVAPHFSKYVLAYVQKPDEPSVTPESSVNPPVTSDPSTTPGTQTGDNGFVTTIVIFGVMAAVSLGTAVVATKAKKKTSK